jgi:hypothetical protein
VTIDKLIEVMLALAPRLGKNGLEGDKATPNTKTHCDLFPTKDL